LIRREIRLKEIAEMTLLAVIGWVLGSLIVLVGLAGTILPILPGVPLVFLGLLTIAAFDGFQSIGLLTILLLAGLTILSVAVDFLATSEGARRFGAGRPAILGALAGLMIGVFFGLPGVLLGPFLGAAVAHFLTRGSIQDSLRAGAGASIGMVTAVAAKLVIAVVMLVWFVAAWLM
jgi:uncharacterized protein